MARRVPGAGLRMEEAALELYESRGISCTTAAEIAAAAGVTERTFFRHFRDKLEVVFGDEGRLRATVADAVIAAPADASPFVAVQEGLLALTRDFATRRASLLRRARVVAANPELRERELAKSAEWVAVIVGALQQRGVDAREAELTSAVGLTLFRFAYSRWVEDDSVDLVAAMREVVDELRLLLPDSS